MKKLYRFDFDCGRMGSLEGLFVAEESQIDGHMGKNLTFGEVLGKHSDIGGPLEECDLTIMSEDQEFIGKVVDLLGESISGYNPLDYIDEYEEEHA